MSFLITQTPMRQRRHSMPPWYFRKRIADAQSSSPTKRTSEDELTCLFYGDILKIAQQFKIDGLAQTRLMSLAFAAFRIAIKDFELSRVAAYTTSDQQANVDIVKHFKRFMFLVVIRRLKKICTDITVSGINPDDASVEYDK